MWTTNDRDRRFFFCPLEATETLNRLTEAFELERSKQLAAWMKNDHLGYEIMYVYKGVVKKYRPDFLIRLATGKMLVLEVKGQDTQQDKTKREFLAEWVKAVNQHGGFDQ